MQKASHFLLDWRPEFSKLSPYLAGRGGVVRVDYQSENAAPDIFNHILKEKFGTPGDGIWLSLRIDRDWFTTRRIEGILDELDRLLSGAGFPADRTAQAQPLVNLVADNNVDGDLTATFTGNTFNLGHELSGKALVARAAAICSAMSRLVRSGGHFMIVVNDTPLPEQAAFWRQIWTGLSEAGADNLLLVIHAGPMAGQRQHQDSPDADERLFLPDSVESDEARQDDIYDDLIVIFRNAGILDASGYATIHLANNTKSMLQLHANLSAVLMSLKRRPGVAAQ